MRRGRLGAVQQLARGMLNALRKQVGSWVVKALLMLLVVSFAIWGIGDVFYGGSQNPAVAKVGESEISVNELADAFNQSLRNLQQRVGTQLTREQAIQLGVMQQALQDLIARRLVDLRARDMGLTVTDATLRELVTSDPMFQAGGRFDRGRFEQLLMASGLNEQDYLASLRQDVMRSTLTEGVAGAAIVPQALVDAVYRHRNEQRGGRYVVIETGSITEVPEPTEEDLQAYHEAHQDRFTAPQYRALTFVTLEPEHLIGEIEVSEEQIEAEYQDRMESYRTPERRTVEQLLAPDRETVEAAAKRLQEGESFAEVAEAMSDQGVTFEELGSVTRSDLPGSIATAVFEQAQGEIAAPVESPFGWHLFRVSAIEPEVVVPLAEVRDELAEELALAEARDRLPGLATRLDDELAAGVPVAEAAATVGLDAKTLAAVDAQGRDPSGATPADLPPWPEFLETAFATGEGEVSLLEETDAGSYFVVNVDSVTPPRVKPVEEVRDALAAAWQAERRRELARKRAEELLARSEEVAGLEQLAEGLEVTTITPVKRDDRGTAQGLNPAIVQALFATEPGSIADEVVPTATGFAIVATDEVIEADPAEDPEGVARLRRQLEAETRNDLLAQFQAALRRDYPVEIDPATINRLIDPEDLGGDGLAG
jgi:peptidyl-prolyl cis-trans isomerase D